MQGSLRSLRPGVVFTQLVTRSLAEECVQAMNSSENRKKGSSVNLYWMWWLAGSAILGTILAQYISIPRIAISGGVLAVIGLGFGKVLNWNRISTGLAMVVVWYGGLYFMAPHLPRLRPIAGLFLFFIITSFFTGVFYGIERRKDIKI